MMWFSWNPWHTPMPSSVILARPFPAVTGTAGASEEAVTVTREDGDKVAYVPIYIGWM